MRPADGSVRIEHRACGNSDDEDGQHNRPQCCLAMARATHGREHSSRESAQPGTAHHGHDDATDKTQGDDLSFRQAGPFKMTNAAFPCAAPLQPPLQPEAYYKNQTRENRVPVRSGDAREAVTERGYPFRPLARIEMPEDHEPGSHSHAKFIKGYDGDGKEHHYDALRENDAAIGRFHKRFG